MTHQEGIVRPEGQAVGEFVPLVKAGLQADALVDTPVDALVEAEVGQLPLFVAVNKGCNMKCWYCTEHGENRSVERGRIVGEDLTGAIQAAYDSGVRTFRFTGGEPSLYQPLGDVMMATQAMGDDVRIAMTTNGTGLDKLKPTLERLRKPSVFISVDTVDDMRADTGDNGIKLDKWLSPELRATIESMPANVETRINTVLTRANRDQIPKIIDYAVEHGVDVKIFELLLRDYFYVADRTSQDTFTDQYVSVRELLPEFEAKYGATTPYKGTGGRGMPMFSFQAGDSKIVCFDSNAGSHYGDVCDTCPLFPCQEGLYAMTLDSNGVLHPSGCPNPDTYVNISKIGNAEREDAFRRVTSMIMGATLRPDVPDILTAIATKSSAAQYYKQAE